jgi:small basic protein (TIGR04137 family)
MSLDKSLKTRGALVRHRNVLSRAERISMLKDTGKWDETKDIFGLPKVGHRKVTPKKIKTAVAAVPGAEGAAAAEGAAPAAAPAKGAAAKPAAAAPAKAAPAKGAPKGK